MAILCDADSSDENIEDVADPFVLKAAAAEARHQELLERFHALSGNSTCDLKDTTLIQLFLNHEVKFSDTDMMKILCLSASQIEARQLYNSLLGLVKHTSSVLKARVYAKSLSDMPLSDIRRLCYKIADRFELLFYVPVKIEPTREEFNISLCFELSERYNCMWPILSLLHREYDKL